MAGLTGRAEAPGILRGSPTKGPKQRGGNGHDPFRRGQQAGPEALSWVIVMMSIYGN